MNTSSAVLLSTLATTGSGPVSVHPVIPWHFGLTIEETFEFETLDDLAPSDNTAWRDGVPITNREKRWLELYQKHDDAWKDLLKKRVSEIQRK
jgi:hypothetical protein